MILLQIKTKKKTSTLIASNYKLTRKSQNFSGHIKYYDNTLLFTYTDPVYLYANNDDFCKYDSYYIANIGEIKLIRHIGTKLDISGEGYNDKAGTMSIVPININNFIGYIGFGYEASGNPTGYCRMTYKPEALSDEMGINLSDTNQPLLEFSLDSIMYLYEHQTFYEFLKDQYKTEDNFLLPHIMTDNVVLTDSYDFSLYGITYSDEYVEVNDPSLE